MSKHAPSRLSGALGRQRGISLVELMIGIALSLLVLTAVIYVFAGSRASYRHQESFSAVQESGRIALELLNRDIRMAGNPGCGNVTFLNHLSPGVFDNAVAITPAFGATAADPDGITVVRGSAAVAVLAASPAANQIELNAIAPLGAVAAGDRLLLSDCSSTQAVTVNAVAGNLLTLSAPLVQQLRPGSQVMRLETVVYAVNVATRELQRNGQAVAAGVTNMQLLYGISDTAGRSVNRYVENPAAATPPAAMGNVVAVKLEITVADGPEISMPFSSTIALRNRTP